MNPLFLDLVESHLYIPHPDRDGVVWKEGFFKGNHNLLGTVLPDFAWLSDVIKVIDVPGSCFGRTLSIHMNSDQERAVAFLTESNPEAGISQESSNAEQMFNSAPGDQGHEMAPLYGAAD